MKSICRNILFTLLLLSSALAGRALAQTSNTGDGFGGIVRANNGSVLQVEGFDDATQSIFLFNVSLASGGKVFDQSGNEIALGQIPVGNGVNGIGEKQANGDFLAYEIHDGGAAPTGGGGGERYFGGNITAVTSTSFSVSWENPQDGTSGVDTYTYDSSTEIMDVNGNSSSLVVGQFVEGVAADLGNGTFHATHVTTYDGPGPGGEPGDGFGGIVRSNNGSVLQLEGYDDISQTSFMFNVTLAAGGKVFDLNMNEISLGQIPVGNIAHGVGEKQSNGDWLATEVHDGGLADTGGGGDDEWQPGDTFEFGGKVEFLGNGFLILLTGDQNSGETYHDTVYFDPGIVKDPQGNPATLSVGLWVSGTVVVQTDKRLVYTSLTVAPDGYEPGQPFTKYGEVVSFGADFIEIRWEENGQVHTETVPLTAGVPVVDQDGNPAQLEVGQHVGIEVDATSAQDIVILKIIVQQGGEPMPFQGVVAAVGADYLDIAYTDETGKLDTVRVKIGDKSTLSDENGNPITISQFAVGDKVHGKVNILGPDDLTAAFIAKGDELTGQEDFVGGVIRQIATDYIMVFFTDHESGDTGTVKVLIDNQTTYADEQGNPISFTDFAVGDQVYAKGEVTTGGDLLAKELSQLKLEPTAEINFTGQIIRAYGDQLFLSGVSPTGITYFLRLLIGSDTQLHDAAGNVLTIANFARGEQVHGEGGITGDYGVSVTKLVKGGGDNITAGQKVPSSGIITEVGSGYFVGEYGHPAQSKRNNLDAGTVIQNSSGGAASLAVGDFFSAVSETGADGSLKVLEVTVYDGSSSIPGVGIPLQGQISQVGQDYLVVQDITEGELKILVLKNTRNQDGTPLSAGNFRVGEQFSANGIIQACELVVLTDAQSTAPDTLDFHGEVVAIGTDYFDIELTDGSGNVKTYRGFYTSATPIKDRDGNPAALAVGDELSVRALPRDDNSFNALSIVVESQAIPMPEPGDTVDVEGTITQISGNRINLAFDSPDSPVSSAWIDIPTGTVIATSAGVSLQLGWLSAGDELYLKGVVNQDGISLTVTGKVEYLTGGLRVMNGKVVSVGASQFEMEGRDATGKSIIAQVAVSSSTKIVRQSTGVALTISDIIKGTTVTAVVRLNSGTSYNGLTVTVPPRERMRVEGRVLELLTGGFALEVKDNQSTYRAAVTTSGSTVWLQEIGNSYQPSNSSALAIDKVVLVSGVRTGSLSASADTVIVRDTGELEVITYKLRNGKLSGSKLTYSIDLNHGAGPTVIEAPVSMTVTPDYTSLSGTIDLSVISDGIHTLKLSKVSGTAGVLTGRWSGYSQATGEDKVLVTAELFQAGTAVTGTVTRGGQATSGTDETPQTGDEVNFIGQVTSVATSSIIVTYLNQLNQKVDKSVIVHSGTQYLDTDGKAIKITLADLLSREVDVTGILQDNLSVVASKVEVYPVSGDNNVSLNLPLLKSLSWTSSTRTVKFSVGGTLLDAISTSDVEFSGQLASDGNSFTLKATVGTETLTFSARRISGDGASISGEWTGSVSQVVSDRTKIWPAFLTVFETGGKFGGNYEIGASRFKSVVTTRNNAPVFQPVAEVLTQEGQPVTVQLTATDPDGDPVTLSVSGVPVTGSTFTDNGNGTGTYNLTVPQLGAGQNELFVNFQADDGKGGVTSLVVEIEVTRLNRPPVLSALPDTIRLLTGKKYEVTIPASDTDGGVLEFEFSGLPTWAWSSSSKVVFSPPSGSEGAFTFTVKVEDDDDGEASRTYAVKVTRDNRAPRFEQIEPVSVQAGANVSFTVKASDPDAGDVVTYAALVVSGVSALPAGSSFDPASGAFNWTPSQQQVGPFKAGFVATDSRGARAWMTVNIFVGQVAGPPSIVVPDTVRASQGQSASFKATGQSSSGGAVQFLARNLPNGSQWNNLGDSLEWHPTYQQQGEFVVTMSASDGSFRTDRDVVIVVAPVQQTPTLEQLQNFTVVENQVLRFQVNGSYPDGGRVVFDPLLTPPLNSSFDPVTGSFRFLPDYTQAGSYPLTFNVTAPDGNVYSVSTTITVTDKNRKPKLADLPNRSLTAGEALTFNVTATDPDLADVLTYAVENLPGGASFSAGTNPPVFSWTPQADGVFEVSFTATDPGQLSDRATVVITVGEQNQPPVLGQLSDLKVAEGDILTVVVSASDPEGDPVSVFVSPLPTNADFNNDSKTFTFRPSYAQSGRYNLRFVASDGELTDESRITVSVADVPLPPSISVPADWSVAEGQELKFTVSVRDASGNRRSVFSSNLPPGATLDNETGEFSWQPFFNQADDYVVTFNASDGSMSSQADVRIQVTDSNQAPVLFRVEHQEVVEGDVIGFEISAFDPDGDDVTIGLDPSGTPYINSAEIRNNNVFVFNTALLDPSIQIPSAVFKVTADDGRGGADTMQVDFRIIRRDDVNVPDVPPGGTPFSHGFPGTGLSFSFVNNGANPLGGQITGFEVSGELTPGGNNGGVLLAGADEPDLNRRYPQLAGSKDKVIVRPFLADDGSLGGDFYSVRRGWGLDLSSDLLTGLTSLQFDLTLTYQDRDIPATDIPEFQEAAISIFGLDVSGNFVQVATQLDTVANTATAPVDLSQYTDFTLGVILDLAAPVISYTSKLVATTNESGPYNVITTIVDNVIISNARLYYSTDGETYSSVALTRDQNLINGYTGNIPGKAEGNTVYYYISASDEEHTVTDPPDAPQSAYQFSILLDGISGAGAGDADGNGRVDIFDLLQVLKILSGKAQATPGADADGNGRVDIFDLLAVLKLL